MTTWMKSGLTALVALAALCSACTVTAPSVADPGFDIGSQTPTPLPDQTEQLLRVTIFDGNFDANIYEEQSGATQMLVISTGGPYTFEVDNLIERRELPAFGAVVIDYDTTAPRRYTMRAYSSTASSVSSAATAVLDIEPVGSR